MADPRELLKTPDSQAKMEAIIKNVGLINLRFRGRNSFGKLVFIAGTPDRKKTNWELLKRELNELISSLSLEGEVIMNFNEVSTVEDIKVGKKEKPELIKKGDEK